MADGRDNPAPGLDKTLTAPTAGEHVAPAQADTNGELTTGSRVDRYILLDRVGAGGMGIVYAAYDPELDRRVAIKFLHAGPNAMHERGRTRFQREAQAMARVSHPNVASVYDVGSFRGQLFLTMEFVQGTTLRERFDELGADWRSKWALLRSAGEGLAAAHAREIVHRDFKPDNVLVDETGEVRVTDFGLAHALGSSGDDDNASQSDADQIGSTGSALDTPLTRTGGLLGTPKYMAPEQHRAEPTSPRTDQFAFCIVAHEALYDEHPFEGATAAELAAAVTAGRRRPSKPAPGVPARVRRAIDRGLSVDAADRFDSITDLLIALDPDKSRLRRIQLVAAVALVVAVAAVLFLAIRSRGNEVAGPDCHAYEDKLSVAWNADKREAIIAAFTANGAPYASDTGTYLIERIDGWTRGWTEMYVDACEATHVHGEQSGELLDLRMYCLGERLNDVAALADVYSSDVDDTALNRATSAADKMPTLTRCADAQALRALAPMPEDPAEAAHIEGALKRLSESRALYQAGQYEASATADSTTLTEAAEVDFLSLTARAQYEDARALMVLRRLDEAETRMFAAAETAAAAGDRELESRAWVALVALKAIYQARPDEALVLSRVARSALAATGGQPTVEARLHINIGAVHWANRHFPEAKHSFAEAVEVLETAGDESSTTFANAVGNLATALSEMGHHVDAIEYLERSLKLRQTNLGNAHPDVAYSLQSLCWSRAGVGEYSAALQSCERAAELRLAVFGPEYPELLYLYGTIGAVLNAFGSHDRAISIVGDAVATHERIGGTDSAYFVELLLPLIDAYRGSRDFEAADAILDRARSMWTTLSGEEEYVALSLSAGLLALARGRAHEALEHCERVRDYIAKGEQEEVANNVEAHRCVGEAHAALGNGDQATGALRVALDLADPDNNAPEVVARLNFALARSLPRSATEEAVAKARQALAGYERSEVPVSEELERVRRWLADH